MASFIQRTVCQHTVHRTALRTLPRIQSRLKTYLVGIDGSSYGYSALKTAAQMTTDQDKLISIHFPPNIAVQYSLYTMAAGGMEVQFGAEQEQTKASQNVIQKCHEIVDLWGHQKTNYDAKLGAVTFSAKQDVVQACYDTNCDVLFLGSRGLSHSYGDKVSDTLHRAGSTADYCVHHCPCDVMVVKQEHDNLLFK
eukprot:1090565_1